MSRVRVPSEAVTSHSPPIGYQCWLPHATSHSPPIGYQCWLPMLPLTPLPSAITAGYQCYLALPSRRLSMLATNDTSLLPSRRLSMLATNATYFHIQTMMYTYTLHTKSVRWCLQKNILGFPFLLYSPASPYSPECRNRQDFFSA